MKRRWACICIPLFPCQRLIRQRPELQRKAFVVIEETARQLRIISPSPTASRHGIRPGMTLTAARSLCSGIPAFEYTPHEDALALETIAEWARGLGPWVSIYSDNAVAVETGSSAATFGGEEKMLRAAKRGLAKLGYIAHVAVADTPRAAHALSSSEQNAVANAGDAALMRLPLIALSLEPGCIEELITLGIYTLSDLLALPRNTLSARFDRDLVQKIMEFTGELVEQPLHFTTSSFMAESVEFDTPIEDGEGLLFVLKMLADRLGERLQAGGLGVRQLLLCLKGEKETVTETLSLAEPQAKAKTLLLLMAAKLETLSGLENIHAITLEAVECNPLQAARKNLFSPRADKSRKDLAALIDRLSARIGVDGVYRPELSQSYLPENEWSRESLLEAPKDFQGEQLLPRRPSHLFDTPQAIQVETSGGVPTFVSGQAVIHAEGPERISSGWNEYEISRDYWRVTMQDGECLWVYRDGASAVYCLHGVFA